MTRGRPLVFPSQNAFLRVPETAEDEIAQCLHKMADEIGDEDEQEYCLRFNSLNGNGNRAKEYRPETEQEGCQAESAWKEVTKEVVKCELKIPQDILSPIS